MNFVNVVAGNHAIDVDFKPPSENRLQTPQHSSGLDSFFEVAGDTAHRIVVVLQAIQRDVDVQFKFRIAFQAMLGNLINAAGLEPVGRQVDIPHTILRDEEVDDVFEVPPQGRLASAEPQVGKLRHVFRQLDDLLPVQISRAIQFIPVEAGIAGGVAVRCDEKNQGVELAASPRYTSVRLGAMSLYRICRHVMLRPTTDLSRLYSNNNAVSGANRI